MSSCISVGGGLLSFGARPKLASIDILKTQFSALVCLLNPREDLQILEDKVRQVDMMWVHCPMTCASQFILKDKPSFDSFRSAIDRTAGLLQSGERLFVHCAGGVHRTGVFVKTLLLRLGMTSGEIDQAMAEVRQTTTKSCGLHRLELAEELARMIEANESPAGPWTLWDGLRMTELLCVKDNPLLWIKYTPVLPNLVQADLFATDFGLTKVIHGFKICFPLDHALVSSRLGYNWHDARSPVQTDVDRVRSLKDARELIEGFCESSLPVNNYKFAGVDAHLDVQFAAHFMKSVASAAHYRVVDLSSLASFLNVPMSTGPRSPHEDLAALIQIKRTHFEITPMTKT